MGWKLIEDAPETDDGRLMIVAWPHPQTTTGWMYDFWSFGTLQRTKEAFSSGLADQAPHLFQMPTHWDYEPTPPAKPE